jgi:hypothetical protein
MLDRDSSSLAGSSASGATLGAALDLLGTRLASTGSADHDRSRTYRGVRFYTDSDHAEDYRDCVVLCPGIPRDALREVGNLLESVDVAAMIIGSSTDDLHTRRGGPTATLVLLEGDWAELANLLRSLLTLPSQGQVSGVPLGDLFGLANALATLAAAAVSLVDANGHVVGYSTHPDQPIDDMRRRSTLLLREEIPLSLDPDYRAVLASRGPMHFHAESSGSGDAYGRVATAVRAADEFLGSVWVVQVDDAASESTVDLLEDVQPLVAEHMLHARERANDDDRRDSALLKELVEDGRGARVAAAQLMIQPERGCVAVCFRVRAHGSAASTRSLHRALALVRSLSSTSAMWTRVTIIGPHVVALIAGSPADRVRAFSESVVRLGTDLVAGIGSEARTVRSVQRSYREAVSCAALLFSAGDDVPDSPVASYDQVRDLLAIQAIGDVINASDDHAGDAADRLAAHDRAHSGDLSRTVLAYLDAQGNVREAAEALHVHQNTVRYRLDLLRRELDIDLGAPATRLWLWLRLAANR